MPYVRNDGLDEEEWADAFLRGAMDAWYQIKDDVLQ